MDAIVHLSIICIWVGRLFSSLQILNWMMQAQAQAEPQRGRLTSGLRPLIILSSRPDCLSLLLLKHGYIFSRRIVLEDTALKMQYYEKIHFSNQICVPGHVIWSDLWPQTFLSLHWREKSKRCTAPHLKNIERGGRALFQWTILQTMKVEGCHKDNKIPLSIVWNRSVNYII